MQGKSVPMMGAEYVLDKARKLTGSTTLKAITGRADATQTAANFMSRSILKDAGESAARLGIASAISSWQGGIDDMVTSATYGAITGGAFPLIANYLRVGNPEGDKLLRTVAGSLLGTSTVTTYVESAAGVKAGGRTGMTSLVIGLLFLACIFLAPLATSLPKEIDGAALIYIATLFVRNIVDIEWDDIAESGPAVLAMLAMPFTYSISHGIALAFIAYAAIKILTGRFDVSPAIWVIAALSVVSFAVA